MQSRKGKSRFGFSPKNSRGSAFFSRRRISYALIFLCSCSLFSPTPKISIKKRIESICLEGEGRIRFVDGGLKKTASFVSRYQPRSSLWLVELNIPFKGPKVLKFFWRKDARLKDLHFFFDFYHHKRLGKGNLICKKQKCFWAKQSFGWREKNDQDFVLFHKDFLASFSHWSEQGFFRKQTFSFANKKDKLILFFASCHKP